MAFLELKKVSKFFGKLAALSDINLEIGQGELIGLVGPNGSGKSTLFNVISGFHRATEGNIIYDGRNITGLRPDQIASRGLVRSFQSNVLFKEATVLENVVRGCYLQTKENAWQVFFNTSAYRHREREILRRSEELLFDWGLSEVRDVLADELPHGYQRCLGLAVAIAAKPKLLLMDEPVSGMSNEEIADVMAPIKELAKQGMTIILVEHHVKTVLDFCQRLVVLDYGHKIADGDPLEVTSQRKVIEAYLGTEGGSGQ